MVRAHVRRLDYIGVHHAPLTLCASGYWSPENITTQFTSMTWDVTGGVGNAGPYQVAFIMKSGSNALLIQNVRLLFDDKIVAKDEGSGKASWEETGDNIFKLTTT